MARHSERLKHRVVRQYLSGVAGFQTLGHKHGIDKATVRRWVERFRAHGAKGLRKKPGVYTAEYKLSVLKRMKRDHLSYRQVSALYDIRETTAIARWAREYASGGIDALVPRRGQSQRMKLPPKPPDPGTGEPRALGALRKENEYLRAEVAYLKKLEALAQAKRPAPKKRK
jgi:transposase